MHLLIEGKIVKLSLLRTASIVHDIFSVVRINWEVVLLPPPPTPLTNDKKRSDEAHDSRYQE